MLNIGDFVKMRIGLRTVKTALAVTLSLFIANILKLESPFFAGIAAIITMQITVSESFTVGRNRMLGTFLGALLGLLYSLLNIDNLIVIGIIIVFIISFCNKFNWNNSISITAIVFLSIVLDKSEGDALTYCFNRILDTFIGIATGVLINYLIYPFNMRKKIHTYSIKLTDDILSIVKYAICKNKEVDIKSLRDKINTLEKDYSIIKSELKISNNAKNDDSKIENIITLFEDIYKHLEMLATFENCFSISEDNINILNKFSTIKLDVIPSVNEEENIVFNYHLNKVLTLLFNIKKSYVK